MTSRSVASPSLSIRDELVTQLLFDFAFSIATDGSLTRIEGPFELISPGGAVLRVDPEHPTHSDLLLQLHAMSVDGDAFDDGTLDLRFTNGFGIRVMPSEYEAFSLTRKDGEMVISREDGGLTHFGPRP